MESDARAFPDPTKRFQLGDFCGHLRTNEDTNQAFGKCYRDSNRHELLGSCNTNVDNAFCFVLRTVLPDVKEP